MSEMSQLMLLFLWRYFVSATVYCLSIRARLRPIVLKQLISMPWVEWLAARDIVIVTRLLSCKTSHRAMMRRGHRRPRARGKDGGREGLRGACRRRPGRVGRMHGSVTVWSGRAEWHLAATWRRRLQLYCRCRASSRSTRHVELNAIHTIMSRAHAITRHRRRILKLYVYTIKHRHAVYAA